LAMPVLAGAGGETLFETARADGETGGFALYTEGDWLIGVRVEDARVDLGLQTQEIYREVIELARGRGRRLARIWNYVPSINEDAAEGLENYRVFCRGRAAAFDEAGGEGVLPAASAVGGVAGKLAVIFAAVGEEVRLVENPEQVPAYDYPEEHGPRAPSFSRASQVMVNGRRWTFISGTAAIKGHATVAAEDLGGQINCTLDNLRLVSLACGLGPDLAAGAGAERHFKVYLRDASELGVVRAELEARLLRGTDRVSWLRSDICRAALKLEIEATVIG
jgi:chorismate lyase / 3-hydroxybenzoate synthase